MTQGALLCCRLLVAFSVAVALCRADGTVVSRGGRLLLPALSAEPLSFVAGDAEGAPVVVEGDILVGHVHSRAAGGDVHVRLVPSLAAPAPVHHPAGLKAFHRRRLAGTRENYGVSVR